jgi:hypothetical protein
MRTDVKRSTSSHSEPSRRYHNLLYIPRESGYDSSSGLSASSSTTLTPVEYIIYPIGLHQVLFEVLVGHFLQRSIEQIKYWFFSCF